MMFWTMFDPLYWMLLAPGLLLAVYATAKTKSAFARYSNVQASSGVTGAQAAARMLQREGVQGVNIEMTRGMLSDHYDPRSHTLRLSRDVYASSSLSAIGVACHEAGHALQHARNYAPLAFRSALVPVTQFSSHLAYVFIIGGWFFGFAGLAKLGVILFSAAVVFSIVTLPVEWDASARAKKAMVEAGLLQPREQAGAAQVLNAAFLTYVASAVTALLTLLYYMMRLGLFGRDD